jgi:chromosome segregation ATPase
VANQDTGPAPHELSPAAADAVRHRREALHAATTELEEQLATVGADPDQTAARLGPALDTYLATLEAHAEAAEAADGMLAQIIHDAPWFGPRVEELRHEHRELPRQARELAERAAAGGDLAALLTEARDLARTVERHRHRATSLMQDAYTLDLSAGD